MITNIPITIDQVSIQVFVESCKISGATFPLRVVLFLDLLKDTEVHNWPEIYKNDKPRMWQIVDSDCKILAGADNRDEALRVMIGANMLWSQEQQNDKRDKLAIYADDIS